MKNIWKYVRIAVALLAAGIYYYVSLPAINIHSVGFWIFLVTAMLLMTGIVTFHKIFKENIEIIDIGRNRVIRNMIKVLILIVIIFAVGALLSSEIINARQYQQLMQVTEGEFTQEIAETDFSSVPLLDKESAKLLGNRKMGTMVDMVSQYEVSSIYTQINYQDVPVRVSPLEYASWIKWFTNRAEGIPAYIKIDMATQETECVRLPKGQYIKYSPSEHFGRNIYRHLRFRYPTYIFDDLSFEIDEEGTPYWICPVKKYNVGLFGGQTIGKVVLCNAITGETVCHDIEEVPQWVDHVYSAELLIELYDYQGKLKNGFLNSILGQKGCLMTTDGYNYIVKDDDVWVYTGVTSVAGDESNVGFVLMNQRTMESRYYACPGAEEYSAMDSAKGQVQHLGYTATFPLLLNVAGEPTYFMALKDSAGLVKMYAMVNISKYQNVAIGNTVTECVKNYQNLLKQNGISSNVGAVGKEVTGAIKKISPVVIDGNSHYYVTLDGRTEIFDINVSMFPEIVTYEEENQVTFIYLEGTKLCEVTGIQ